MSRMKITIIIFILLFAMSIFLNWSNNSVVITQYNYANEKIPKGFNNYKIVQLSDLHNKVFGKNQEKFMEKIKEIEPDAVVITGDIVDKHRTKVNVAVDFVDQLTKIAPVYYINGNHEMVLDFNVSKELYDSMENSGVKLLLDDKVKIKSEGDDITIAGLSEETVFNGNIKPLDGMNEKFTILLAHEPHHLMEYSQTKSDLVFCGHAHGGQIRLPFIGGLYSPGQGVHPKLTSGIHKEGNTTMVISRGLGNSEFPFRVFNRPEIVVVTLQCNK
ncbi:MAG: metallophosphoesterase [Anaerovoracaceae bacterium]